MNNLSMNFYNGFIDFSHHLAKSGAQVSGVFISNDIGVLNNVAES